MIRVLIADDSPTLRQLIRIILESDPKLAVVGEATNGEEAVSLCQRLNPDIITMDIHMPKMNGFEAIERIMAEMPRPIVVLTTPDSDKALNITYKGIAAGALAVIGKPRGFPGKDLNADELINHVKTMAEVKVVGRRMPLKQKVQIRPVVSPRFEGVAGQIRLIAIGASTGGPPALQTILKQFPVEFGVPVAVVQHISPEFTAGLARWLNDTILLRVKLAEYGERMQPGIVYLAPGDKHLKVGANNAVLLDASPKVDGHRPSATVLFESAAHAHGAQALGALLTGMGRDGARGLKTMYDKGCRTIAQNENTCVVFGMSAEAIAIGAASEVLPLSDIGRRIIEIVETAQKNAMQR